MTRTAPPAPGPAATPPPAGPPPAGAPAAVPAAARAAGLALAVVSGAAIAVQSRINGELGARLADGILAATISFGTGMVLLLVLVPALPSGRQGLRRVVAALRDGSLRPWQCLGGVCGAFLVVTQGVSAAALGVAIFTVALVGGQCLSSLLVDRAGLGPGGAHPLTARRLFGAALAVAAVAVAVSDRLTGARAVALAVLPALAGLGIAWQQAVNGRVRAVAGSPLPATFVNFVAGTTVLLVACAVELALRDGSVGPVPTQWWLYLGGALGMAFIAVAASVVRLTGVLLLGLGTIAGQLVGAVAIDLAVPGGAARPGATTLAGVALTLVAVVVAALPGRRR